MPAKEVKPSSLPGDPFGSQKETIEKEAPEPRAVAFIHSRSDVDSDQHAQHHTLGIKHDQSSPGDHIHDGSSSKKLLTGKILTGSKGGNAALANLIDMLELAFGFTDNTT